MKRNSFLTAVILSSLVWFLMVMSTVQAKDFGSQRPKRVAILQLGSHGLIDSVCDATEKYLRDKFGENIEIDKFNANFQQTMLTQSSAQMIEGKYDVLVPVTTSAAVELVNRSSGVEKIVFSFVTSPGEIWGKGDRPANVTGVSDQIDYARNVQLIGTLFPERKRIGYLINRAEPNARKGLNEMLSITKTRGLSLVQASVGDSSGVAQSAAAIIDSVDVFLVGGDNTVVGGLGGLLNEAWKNRLPVFASEGNSVREGAVAAYGIDYNALGEDTGKMVARVLDGEDIARMEVKYYSETKLYANRKSAKLYGLEEKLEKIGSVTWY